MYQWWLRLYCLIFAFVTCVPWDAIFRFGMLYLDCLEMLLWNKNTSLAFQFFIQRSHPSATYIQRFHLSSITMRCFHFCYDFRYHLLKIYLPSSFRRHAYLLRPLHDERYTISRLMPPFPTQWDWLLHMLELLLCGEMKNNFLVKKKRFNTLGQDCPGSTVRAGVLLIFDLAEEVDSLLSAEWCELLRGFCHFPVVWDWSPRLLKLSSWDILKNTFLVKKKFCITLGTCCPKSNVRAGVRLIPDYDVDVDSLCIAKVYDLLLSLGRK